MDALREFICQYSPLSTTEWARISACFEKMEVKKGTLILREGSICRHLYFIESGLLRFFFLKDGSEVTKFFTEAPYCFTSQASFTMEQPAKESIQALEPSVLFRIPFQAANDLLSLPGWNTFVRKLIQEVQGYTEEILQELQTLTAEERYEHLLKNQPELAQRVPLKYLASYFGIAAPSLSRIRKKILLRDRNSPG